MRYLLLLAVVLVAGECRAEDPLESLNTIEDTVQTMRRTLQAMHLPQEAAPRMVQSRREVGSLSLSAAAPERSRTESRNDSTRQKHELNAAGN